MRVHLMRERREKTEREAAQRVRVPKINKCKNEREELEKETCINKMCGVRGGHATAVKRERRERCVHNV